MPKLSDAAIGERERVILEGARRCFLKLGFHGASMQDICREAKVSPGALYLYFRSKEDLIAGIAEQDCDAVLHDFAEAGHAGDIGAALRDLFRSCLVERPRDDAVFFLQIAEEARRNPRVAEIQRRCDGAIHEALRGIVERGVAAGEIAPRHGVEATVSVMETLAHGLMTRRAGEPDFDPAATAEPLLALLGDLLGVRETA
ncbi:MAG: TetR/AcrR family transcriptional regulator, partial [Hyphomicrobiales bacterium]|nr:TetR/AcrR family transcriptional regulator [Hyphomicrobiales bacterium]MDE2016268.1 TetR/AcrR family transcriptional regulator [Hyphomicrobiales bacterium]